ncbi:RagB/SusD family nutrient uptake outer membrane protein [Sphingobacterium gobiense]|uniref:RagB/SusD family nutrient uptake outer membrane protein n=1 Tax=Sphingobacterium gobiense TaxID=1382456 RepID=A0A2S9JS82_9SPHI|nr:RagB/SusD family nutrient uptake outer membrane protein [Sphingobacterium gobiense]PRD56165.1 RagB/SusD family nutrient uptake outer membrane protein [Sphingobacterium gobiense]
MKRILFYLLFLSIPFSGCENMLDIEPTRVVSEENMWEKMEDTRAALMGVYGLTKSALVDRNAFWLYGEVRSGEFAIPVRRDLRAIAANELNANDVTLETLRNWRRWYAVVNAANIFLERSPEVLEKDARYTVNNHQVDMAQARFLRAFAYFYMSRIWGDVPLITSASEWSFNNKPREEKGKLLAWVEQELLKAAEDMPFRYSNNDIKQQGNYYNEQTSRWDGALATQNSAYAILAHLSAWQGNYPNAAAYTAYIDENYSHSNINYATTANLTSSSGFFYDKHSSQMFGFPGVWAHVEAAFTGHIEELTLAAPVVNKSIPDMYMTKETVVRVFDEAKDQRFSIDTLGNPLTEVYFTNFNGRYPIFSKIKCIMAGVSDPSFRIFSSALVFTRLEDVTLLRAEALAVLGERNGAVDMLNRIRENRGLLPYSEEANGDLIDAIFQERHRELMGEGHRWYDMVRYHKIKNNDPDFVKLINEGGIYWPIAEPLLQQNTLLEQNNYWK